MTTENAPDTAPGDAESPYPRIRRESIGDQTMRAIKQMIAKGQLRPGQALPPERELAVTLGISRPTLRQAIFALTTMNILESRQGDGTFVASLDSESLLQPLEFMLALDDANLHLLFEVRRILESGGARLAAERITEEELQELENLWSESKEAVDDADAYFKRSVKFHAGIVAAAKNPILSRLASTTEQLSLASRVEAIRREPSVRHLSLDHHRDILEALRERSPEAAFAAMLEHLLSIEQAYGD